MLMSLPVLTSLLSFGGVVAIPIVRLKAKQRYAEADIRILGPGENTRHMMENALSAQSGLLQQMQDKGIICACTQYFVNNIRRTESYWRCRSPVTLRDSLKAICSVIEHDILLHGTAASCQLCRDTFNDKTVQAALNLLKPAWHYHGDLLRLAGEYEDWLTSRGLGLIKEQFHIKMPLRPKRNYTAV